MRHGCREFAVPLLVLLGCLTAMPLALGDAGSVGEIPRLRPGLSFSVEVFAAGETELGPLVKRVAESGRIALPLVGEIAVDGLTLEQLRERLSRAFAEYLRDPQVVVEFVMDDDKEAVSPYGYVTVMGRVKTPGWINIPPTRDLTVSRAIQLAGGFDTSAKETAIRITRRNGEERETIEIDLRAIGEGRHANEDIRLQPGDVVYVPEQIF
jgi:polysaccharide export outer membrane protein